MLETADGQPVFPDSGDSKDSEYGRKIAESLENLGFRSEHRLHTAAEFSLVFAARRVIRGKFFDLHYLANKPDHGLRAGVPRVPSVLSVVSEPHISPLSRRESRLGLVIAKKLARRAVQRNLIKRLAREVFRQVRRKLPAFDLVLRLTRSPGNHLGAEARQAYRADIEQLLERLRQLPPSR